MSIKYNEDEYYSNTFYAKVGGITLKEFNKLEYFFVNIIDFELYVDDESFQKYNEYLDEGSHDSKINEKDVDEYN